MKTLNVKRIKMLFLASALAVSVSACTKDKTKDDKVTITASEKMDASTLADSAEQLVSPYTFMLADKVVDMALQKDPDNKKAQFYKSFLKRMMVFKGLATRVKPMVRKDGNVAEYEKNIASFPESPLKQFLMDGAEDMKSVVDIQTFFVNYRNAVNDFRRFLKLNPDLDLTLNLNPYLFDKEISKEAANSCVVKNPKDGDNNYEVVCDFRNIATKKINSADAVALSQIAAGDTLAWSLYSNYSLEGIDTLSKKIEEMTSKLGRQLTEQEVHQLLMATPGLGRLRNDHNMGIFHEVGADLSAALKWALNYQDRLCPKGIETPNQRRGYIFSNGLCIQNSTELQRNLGLLDEALRGAINVDLSTPEGKPVNTQVDYFALSKKPVADLKSLMPATYNSCGKATSFKDKTIGGVLPRGDADQFLDLNCNK